jgi:hypothetical protein
MTMSLQSQSLVVHSSSVDLRQSVEPLPLPPPNLQSDIAVTSGTAPFIRGFESGRQPLVTATTVDLWQQEEDDLTHPDCGLTNEEPRQEDMHEIAF